MSSFTFSKVLTLRPLETIIQKGDRGLGGRKGARAELCVTGLAFQRAWPAGFVVAMFKGRKVDNIRLQTVHSHTSSTSNSPECHPGQAGRAGQAWVFFNFCKLYASTVRGTSLSSESLVNEGLPAFLFSWEWVGASVYIEWQHLGEMRYAH